MSSNISPDYAKTGILKRMGSIDMPVWDASDIPPRLTPSPEPSPEPDVTCVPTPPARKSIYQSPHTYKWHVNVQPYSTDWPNQFQAIQTRLHDIFAACTPAARYLTIEHIGSTSIPGMSAKPNIDVLCTFASFSDLQNAVEALYWEVPSMPPFAKYTRIPDGGGVQGRESFKIYLPEYNPYYHSTPEQNVYLVADVEANKAGQVQIKGYRTLRNVLCNEEHRDLFEEYRDLKLELAGRAWNDGLEYTTAKNDAIRKILKRGGWTDEEVDEKERFGRRDYIWKEEEEEAAY